MMAVSSAEMANSTWCEGGGVVDIQTEEDREDQYPLKYTSPPASTRWRGRVEGRFERPIPEVGWDFMDYLRWEFEER